MREFLAGTRAFLMAITVHIQPPRNGYAFMPLADRAINPLQQALRRVGGQYIDGGHGVSQGTLACPDPYCAQKYRLHIFLNFIVRELSMGSIELFWPFPGAVINAQNFYAIAPELVGKNVGGICDNELTSAGHPARATYI